MRNNIPPSRLTYDGINCAELNEHAVNDMYEFIANRIPNWTTFQTYPTLVSDFLPPDPDPGPGGTSSVCEERTMVLKADPRGMVVKNDDRTMVIKCAGY
jgi:hypothetical protein